MKLLLLFFKIECVSYTSCPASNVSMSACPETLGKVICDENGFIIKM